MRMKRESGVGGGESEMDLPANAKAPTPDPRPPTPREPHWRLIYAAVLGELAILILIFYAFTKAFA
jgi:hypothetical protein